MLAPQRHTTVVMFHLVEVNGLLVRLLRPARRGDRIPDRVDALEIDFGGRVEAAVEAFVLPTRLVLTRLVRLPVFHRHSGKCQLDLVPVTEPYNLVPRQPQFDSYLRRAQPVGG